MSHNVRSHSRQTASGRTVTVRQHTRKGGGGKQDDGRGRGPVGRVRSLLASRRARRQPDQDMGWADDEPQQSPKEQRRAERDAERARKAAALDDWERDMQFKAAKSGLPAYRPIGTRASDWKPRTPAEHEKAAATFRAMLDEMRDWRSRPEPEPKPEPPMTPQMSKLMGCDTPEGREKYERGRAYREAGYTGPLDKENRIPDPDDPSNLRALDALAGLKK